MSANRQPTRLPRSIRKYLRKEKARLRRQLPVEEASRAVAQLMRGLRRGEPPAVVTTPASKKAEELHDSPQAREEAAS